MTGAPPSGTSAPRSSGRCSSSSPIRDAYSRCGSSRCWTGQPPRSTGWIGRRSWPASGRAEAVPYFYEPFLAAFDPELRKQLGVWYTPNEIVRYMVARVDRALKDDLGIADGLAARNVYVLDPCCGTGAYLAEVLRRIASNLAGKGLGALVGARVKEAATERVFGFEIMPAPFVVAHLQVGLTMQELDAPLSDDGAERAQVFLTNALTGWEHKERTQLLFPELAEERDRADRVKQKTPILVILGNPPYNGFAGVAVEGGAGAVGRLPDDEAGETAGGSGAQRSLRAVLPHGRATHRREDRARGHLLHLELLVARRAVVHGDARAISGGVRFHPDRQPARRSDHFGVCPGRPDERNRLRIGGAVTRHQDRREHHAPVPLKPQRQRE